MKIKGKLLLKEGLLKTEVGELVYISQQSIAIYDKCLYLNIADVFFREETGSFIIPIKRIGLGEEDFEIDMNGLPLIHLMSVEKPQKRYGWIGPFQFEFEYYTKEKLWNRLDCIELLNLLYQSKLDGKVDDLKNLREIRIRKFVVKISSYNLSRLKEEKDVVEKYLSELLSALEEMINAGGYTDVELSAQKLLIKETKVDLSILDQAFETLEKERKDVLFEKMTLEEHEKALSSIDFSAEDADYDLAARHKAKIDELKKLSSTSRLN
jgi:hypothetical protein